MHLFYFIYYYYKWEFHNQWLQGPWNHWWLKINGKNEPNRVGCHYNKDVFMLQKSVQMTELIKFVICPMSEFAWNCSSHFPLKGKILCSSDVLTPPGTLLQFLPQLEELDISWNDLIGGCLPALTYHLRLVGGIRELRLCSCRLNTDDMSAIGGSSLITLVKHCRKPKV